MKRPHIGVADLHNSVCWELGPTRKIRDKVQGLSPSISMAHKQNKVLNKNVRWSVSWGKYTTVFPSEVYAILNHWRGVDQQAHRILLWWNEQFA